MTLPWPPVAFTVTRYVLMPCRALEAFRPRGGGSGGSHHSFLVLMPCRALEAFRLVLIAGWALGHLWVLMPCRALEAFRLR